MKKTIKAIKRINITIILTTFFLFFLALFLKGITHDIMLELGVFLVSAKLILTTYYIQVRTNQIDEKLDDLAEKISKLKN